MTMDFTVRFQTMATTLAVEMLGCTGTTEERASLLHKMIQIAAELKSTMGNMFGFAAVMRALELPQVHPWKQWHSMTPACINNSKPVDITETAPWPRYLWMVMVTWTKLGLILTISGLEVPLSLIVMSFSVIKLTNAA